MLIMERGPLVILISLDLLVNVTVHIGHTTTDAFIFKVNYCQAY